LLHLLTSAVGTLCPLGLPGRAWQLCPGTSDIDLFGDLKCVVDLDAEVANGTFDPNVAE
jgi:hypothetical protein